MILEGKKVVDEAKDKYGVEGNNSRKVWRRRKEEKNIKKRGGR